MRAHRCIVMGAAGRDFHDFQTFFRDRPEFHVCCFTAAQIPYIASRAFPRQLAGPSYDADIPIFPEAELPDLIRRYEADFVFLAYSDLSHLEVMHRASVVQAAGASFALLGPRHTCLESSKPVVAVVAARTGAGKSPLCHALAGQLAAAGHRVGVVRHPMPYGDLTRQRVQRFAKLEDLDQAACTVEEREEYLPYIELGIAVHAGVDYAAVLQLAEQQSDLILWDGGNNDRPFFAPTLSVVVLDALRPGHEVRYYPGETNLRAADVAVINKVAGASAEALAEIGRNVRECNPTAELIESDLETHLDAPERVRGQRVLVIEDGPTLTHGGMSHGAGTVAALAAGAAEICDVRAAAVGEVRATLQRYPHIQRSLPALGYSPEQLRDLRATIDASGCDLIVDASPARVCALVGLEERSVRVGYRFVQRSGPLILDLVEQRLRVVGT